MTEIEHQGTIAMSAPEGLPLSDIVARLRRYRPRDEFGDPVKHTICDEAADQIERLRTPPPQDLSRGSQDVLAERRRQVEVEDFRIDEDDHYTSGEMVWAATCYLQNAAVAAKMQGLGLLTASQCDERGKSLPKPEAWPWDAEWWKPAGQRRDLVKAAALILAEIERLDRAAATLETAHEK
ncbi:hypothetical protein [Pararhizobium sp. DWP3-4]|uniref:hypothetical protein n=1 Tax=Pararhizobium sp. DWP3-4 TaxID=2804565 RepID=UPI003CF5C4E9